VRALAGFIHMVGLCLSLSQTPSGWRLIENRAMLLLDVGFVQTDLWNGDRPAAVTSCA
jgi:hypothetical protein